VELPGPQDHTAWYGGNATLAGTLFEPFNALPVDEVAVAAAEAAALEAAAAAVRSAEMEALVAHAGGRLQVSQERRVKGWEKEDEALVAGLERKNDANRKNLDASFKAGELDMVQGEILGAVKTARLWESSKSSMVRVALPDLPLGPIREDNMEFAAKMTESSGDPGGETTVSTSPFITQAQYDEIAAGPYAASKARQEVATLEAARAVVAAKEELVLLRERAAVIIQAVMRGQLARRRVYRMRILPVFYNTRVWTAIKIQRRFRKKRAVFYNVRLRKEQQMAWRVYHATMNLQRVARGFLARCTLRALRVHRAATNIQRVWNGYLGRKDAKVVREAAWALKEFNRCATVLAATWRMFSARRNYLDLLVVRLCAVQVQRWYRGYLARKAIERIRHLGTIPDAVQRVGMGQEHVNAMTGKFVRTREVMVNLERTHKQAAFEAANIARELLFKRERILDIDRQVEEGRRVISNFKEVAYKDEAVEKELAKITREEQERFAKMEDTVGTRRLKKATAAANAALSKDMVFDILLSLRLQQARKAMALKELETERNKLGAECQALEQKEKAMQLHLKTLSSSLRRNARGFGRVQDDVRRAMRDQGRLLEMAKPALRIVDHRPRLAAIAEHNRAMIQRASDALDAQAEETIAWETELVRRAVPQFVGAMSMVSVLKDLNVAAIREELDEEGTRELLGPVHPDALLGGGLTPNLLPDYHTRVGAGRLALALDEAHVKEIAEIDPVSVSYNLEGGMRTDLKRSIKATRTLAASITRERADRAEGVADMEDKMTLEKYRTVVMGYPPKAPASRVHHISLPKKTGATTNIIAKQRKESLQALRALHAPSRFMLVGPEPMPTSTLLNPEPPSTEVLQRRSHRPAKSVLALMERMGLGTVRGVPGMGSVDPSVESLGAFIPPTGGSVVKGEFGSAGAAPLKQLMNLVGKLPGLAREETPGLLDEGKFSIEAPGLMREGGEALSHLTLPSPGRFHAIKDLRRRQGLPPLPTPPLRGEGPPTTTTTTSLDFLQTSTTTTLATTTSPSPDSHLTLHQSPAIDNFSTGGSLSENFTTRQRRASLAGLSAIAAGSLNHKSIKEVDALKAQGKAIVATEAENLAEDVENLKDSFFDYLGATHDERVEAYQEAKVTLATWAFPKKVRDWGVVDVGAWVRGLGMLTYVGMFEAAGVDGDQLLRMEPRLFRHACGIENMDHLSILLHAREVLRLADVRGDSRLGLVEGNIFRTTAANSARTGAAAQQFSAVMREDNFLPEPSVVFLQTAHGQTNKVETALRTGFDLGSRDGRGNTILHTAAKHGHLVLATKILDMAGDVNAQNNNGEFFFLSGWWWCSPSSLLSSSRMFNPPPLTQHTRTRTLPPPPLPPCSPQVTPPSTLFWTPFFPSTTTPRRSWQACFSAVVQTLG
jgi:hypothetical protein